MINSTLHISEWWLNPWEAPFAAAAVSVFYQKCLAFQKELRIFAGRLYKLQIADRNLL